ncbi:MAG: SsrA-binding protein [Candidatus Coatesbacteria bacterium]|nr:MAG: SsrA-binding protein [Candidatus Coatesbacteria bacterium]
MSKNDSTVEKTICTNRKAKHEYVLGERIEAGLVLVGSEVKALREGKASLVDSYARVKGGEVFLYNCHIAEYAQASRLNHEPRRVRKLLLHRREIKRLRAKTVEPGRTLIPTRLYFSGGRAKVELAIATGKRKYEKRAAEKEKEVKRELHDRYGF